MTVAPDPIALGPVAVLGLGRVGRFLALGLSARGVDVRGWDHAPSPSADDVHAAGVPMSLGPLPAELAACRVFLLPVADRAIEAVARRLAQLSLADGTVALHTSGFHPAGLLRSHLPVHVAVGSFHPVHAFAAEGVPSPVGLPVGLEGEPLAVAAAERVALRLGMAPFRVAPGQKALYHAALALLSNGTVGLFASAEALLARAGVSADQARPLLARLLAATATNLHAAPPARALTGPVQRGDAEVVRAHLAAVAEAAPDEAALVQAVIARLRRLVTEATP